MFYNKVVFTQQPKSWGYIEMNILLGLWEWLWDVQELNITLDELFRFGMSGPGNISTFCRGWWHWKEFLLLSQLTSSGGYVNGSRDSQRKGWLLPFRWALLPFLFSTFTVPLMTIFRFPMENYSTFHWDWGHIGSISLFPRNLHHVQC